MKFCYARFCEAIAPSASATCEAPITADGTLPRPPFTETETEEIAARVSDYVWQRNASGSDLHPARH
jgi:hypothetical protein